MCVQNSSTWEAEERSARSRLAWATQFNLVSKIPTRKERFVWEEGKEGDEGEAWVRDN